MLEVSSIIGMIDERVNQELGSQISNLTNQIGVELTTKIKSEQGKLTSTNDDIEKAIINCKIEAYKKIGNEVISNLKAKVSGVNNQSAANVNVEQPKPVEALKSVETPNPVEAPKSVEAPQEPPKAPDVITPQEPAKPQEVNSKPILEVDKIFGGIK